MTLLKLVALLKRREGLSPEDFQKHWRTTHADLVRGLPGLRRYVQNHTRLSGYRRRDPAWDGVAEVWFDDPDALVRAGESEAMKAVRADERSFLEPLSEQLAEGRSPAHALLESWRGDWRGDPSRLIEHVRY